MAEFRIQSLWRYPVKSMAGEQIHEADVSAAGLTGDRAYALVDTAENKVATAKAVRKWTGILHCGAQFLAEPQTGAPPPPVRITLPGGRTVTSDQADAAARLSAHFNRTLSILTSAPEGLLLEFEPGTVGGLYAHITEAPLAGAAPKGTFFDLAVVHLLTTSSLAALRQAYPGGLFEVRRFRPNVVIDTGDASGFLENFWIGRTVALGDQVLLQIRKPCTRCCMPTLAQGDLPHDPAILRTAAEQNLIDSGDFGSLPCVGVYADVIRAGRVRPGDAVQI